MGKWVTLLCLLLAVVSTSSCSETSSERAAKHEARGDTYIQQKQWREAVIEYKNAVRATPDNAAIHWKLVKTASIVGDKSTAITSLRRVVQLDPNHFDANWALGDVYLTTGNTDEVATIAGNLLRARPEHPAGYLLRAGLALEAGDAANAIELLNQAVKLEPMMARPLLALANLYFAQRESKLAADWYDRAIKAEPNSSNVHLARGYFLIASGVYEEGREEFRKASELSPDQESIHLVLAERNATLGRLDDAEKELVDLIANMNSPKARGALAELKLARGQVAEAKPLVTAILETDTENAVGLYLKGRLALAEQDVIQAVRLFEKATERDATLPGPHFYLGFLRAKEGRMDVAKEEWLQAVRYDPQHPQAHLALALLHLANGAPLEAEREARAVLRREVASLPAAIVLGDALVLRKNWPKAEEVYSAIIRRFPDQPVGYVKLATLRKLQGQPTASAQLFSQALAHAPKDLGILQEYLGALFASAQPHKAESLLREYFAKSSRDPNLWRIAGRLYASQQKMSQAEKAFLKAVELAPDLALVHYELGQWYVLRDQLPAAESAFQTALTKEETNPDIHTAMGLVLAARGQVTESNNHYRRALQLNAKDLVAANNLATSLTDQQELSDALGFARQALNLAPSSPMIKDTVGWVYYKQGQFDKAYPFLAEASLALPQDARVRYHYAIALSRSGKKEAAFSELKAALALPGGFPEADRAAEMLAARKIDE
jgi:tetratricopeptide (TPR) repeat protein